MSKHTPGPWRIEYHPAGGTLRSKMLVGSWPLLGVDQVVLVLEPTWNIHEADLSLLEAAPDLLDAAKEVVRRLKGSNAVNAFEADNNAGMLPALYRELEAEIDKAEGGK